MGRHRDRSQWSLLYNNFLEHKGTIAEYCSKNNINFKTFKNWCYKFRKSDKSNANSNYNSTKRSSLKFIKFKLPFNETIKIRLPNGIIVETGSKNLSMIIKELAHAI